MPVPYLQKQLDIKFLASTIGKEQTDKVETLFPPQQIHTHEGCVQVAGQPNM